MHAKITCFTVILSYPHLLVSNIVSSFSASLLVTPFRYMAVPPPMSAYSIQLPDHINSVCFGPSENSNHIVVMLSDYRMAFYDLKTQGSSFSFSSSPPMSEVKVQFRL